MTMGQIKFDNINSDKISCWSVKYSFIFEDSIELNQLGSQIVLLTITMLQSNNSDRGVCYCRYTRSVIDYILFLFSSQFTVLVSNEGIRYSTILKMSGVDATTINKLEGSNYDNTHIYLPAKKFFVCNFKYKYKCTK